MKSKISIFLLILINLTIFAQADYRILSSDQNSILIEYTPVYQTPAEITIHNQNYLLINFSNGTFINDQPGSPLFSSRIFNIGVPAEFGNTLEIVNSFYDEIQGKLAPAPRLTKSGELDELIYEVGSSYFNFTSNELLSFGSFGFIRDIPIQDIIISPVSFFPERNIIRLYKKIIFKINFSPVKTYNGKIEDKFAEGAVINYQIAKNWGKSQGKLNKVIINSVLASGKWFRFEAPQEGIYKISRSQLQAYGIDAASVDPRTIKIYNNSGKMLTESLTGNIPTDLIENSILIPGEEDGKFDESDYILFYSSGIHPWEYDTTQHKLIRNFNYYSNQNYFWITSGGNPGKRMQNKDGLNDPPQIIQNTTKAFVSLEEDKINIVKSSRHFLGDEYNESSKTKTYMNLLEGLVPGSTINYRFRFVNSSDGSVNLKVEENQTQIFSNNIPGKSASPSLPDYSTGYGLEVNAVFNGSLVDNRSLLKFTFNSTGPSSKGYLDFFEISYLKSLSAINDELLFFSPDTSGVVEYGLNNFTNTNIKVFDVTDFANVKLITNPVLLSGGEFKFRINENEFLISKYYSHAGENYKAPSNSIEIANSNVHGIADGAKYIIITPKNFREQADRLKQHKENNNKFNISTAVFDIDEIFNEFGGGQKDPTAVRYFIKYAFENWTNKPEYVLLFGDGDYDYKNIEGYNKNFIPTYQHDFVNPVWSNNLNQVESFSTDDYFVRVSGNDLKVDLAIGRLPVSSSAEAEIIIDKIVNYENNSEKGSWRNNITLVADDGLTSEGRYEGSLHTQPLESLAQNILSKSFDINKIYLAAYEPEITGAGRRKPQVTKALLEAINNGTLVVNFMGHGNPNVWTHEYVLEKLAFIPQMQNDKHFLLSTFTCDFGYFDNPSEQSGGELFLLSRNGAISVFTAARKVYALENQGLMNSFYQLLFNSPRDTLNLPITTGWANFLSKQNNYSQNDQKYLILGDPTLRLLIPQYPAQIDSINGLVLTDSIQLKALSKIRINGVIQRPDHTKWEDYNGEAILNVYDSERGFVLKEINFPITLQGGTIFRGRVSVVNGNFNAEFMVPKDISYENKNGKMVLYFYNNSVDGLGFTRNFIVGGSDTTTQNDGNGPDINIYFDNASNENGYLINPDSKLIIKLNDETGLNTTGTGIGHKLEGILNDKESEPIDFTNFFTGDLDAGGRSGEVNYTFNDLEMGDYKLTVKAWDIFNNFSNNTTYFSVVNGNDLEIRDVYNYPNPFSNSTTFTLQQNLNQSLDLIIKIYTVAGRLIHQIEKVSVNDKFVKVDWDGRDSDGNLIANGTYFYKVMLKSTDGTFNKSVVGKLAVIR